MKRDILIWFAVMLGMIFIPQPLAAAWKKHTIIDVEGKVTRLYDLSDYNFRMDIEKYEKDDPIQDIYLGEMTGINPEIWQELEVERENPVFARSPAYGTFGRNMAGKVTPVLYYFEIYSLEEVYYLKAFYTFGRKEKDCIVYFRYSDLTREAVEALNASHDVWWK